jgi:hypothetical protein
MYGFLTIFFLMRPIYIFRSSPVLPPVSLHDRLDVGGGVEHQPQPPSLHQDTRESPRHGRGVALAAPNGGQRCRESGVGRRRRKSAATGAAGIATSVSDPDPDWIRI